MPEPVPLASPAGLDDPEITSAVQDYAKAIYAIQTRPETTAVTTNALAERLEVSPASASNMVRKLERIGIVELEPYRGVRLTPQGRRVALEVLRHHRLLELFLAEELGIAWDRVHAEAEILEHHLSEEVEAAIAAKLGHPELDPHGDPIPSPDLEVAERPTVPLDALDAGQRATFVRVSDSDPAMLRYLGERGIRPGDALEVAERQPFGGPLFCRFGDAEHVIGGDLARAMRVEVADA